MKTILTFDVGTTSMKCCAFDENLRLIASSTAEYSLNTQGAHIVEADPEIYWNGMCKNIRRLVDNGLNPHDIVVCGITTQGETSILLDRHGKPLRPAIVWLDDRAGDQAAFLASNIDKTDFYRTTGLTEIGGALPLAKLRWLNAQDDVRGKVAKILLLEDYLIYRLTGEIKTEHSIICSTGYYDIQTHTYREDYLRLADATASILPEVFPCGSIAGTVTKSASEQCLIPQGTPVAVTAMDQTASAIGAGNVMPGDVTETTGTCLTLAATTEKADCTTSAPIQYYTHYDGRYLALAYNATAAIITKWFKDEFIADTAEFCSSGKNPYTYMSELAETISAGSDGLIMLPHFAGKAMPNYSPNVRGCFYGVSLHTGKAHFIRAIMEGVSFMLRENLESFEKAGIFVNDICSLGGGSKDNLWCEIKASVTQKTLHTMQMEESTSLGAAILCAKAIGMTQDVAALARSTAKTKTTYHPDPNLIDTYTDFYRKYLALDRVVTAMSDQ